MSEIAPTRQTVVNPDLLRAMGAVRADGTLVSILRALIEEWAPAQGIRIDAWIDDVLKIPPGQSFADKLSGLPPREAYTDPGRRALDIFSDDGFGSLALTVYDDDRPGDSQRATFGHRHCITFDMLDSLKEAPLARAQTTLRAARSLVEFLAHRYHLLGLTMYRDGSAFAPSPPLAGCKELMRLVQRSEVAEAYADPAVYWAAWSTQQALDADRVLVGRALDIVDELAFKQATYPRQWTLARAARAGLTKYGALADSFVGGFHVHPYEQSYFEAGEGILSAFHYRAEDARVEATAWAQPGTHIAPREVAQLLRWKVDGRLDGGETVREIRVVFPDREQARSQQRVLLDIGCRVFHYGAVPTELVELRD